MIDSTHARQLFSPVFAPLLRSRALTCAVCVAAGAQATLVSAGYGGWQCPFFHALHVPCPGCGLSRASIALLHGEWQKALTFHAFAPLFLCALLLACASVWLPENLRSRLILRVELIERRTGLTVIFLVSLLGYWLTRLLSSPEAFTRLIAG